MIEEKNLKVRNVAIRCSSLTYVRVNRISLTRLPTTQKTFIIATLCSTLIGTFSSSIGLWDRVQDKRKQAKKDNKQDDRIEALRLEVEKNTKAHEERDKRSSRRDEVGDNFEQSGALIQRQFDEGYGRLGRRFAQGDGT